MSKVNILEVLGLCGKQEQQTRTSKALERVPQKYADLFKNGLMPVPEFETVERQVSKPVDPTQPTRHPKRELKPGYRWKFNGTGAYGRKMFIQVPIVDEVSDLIERAESEAQELSQEYFTHAIPKTRDTFEPKSLPGRFRDAGKIVEIEVLKPITRRLKNEPSVLLTFHFYYGFQDSDEGWATGNVKDTECILNDIDIIRNSLDNLWEEPVVSYVKHGANATILVPLEVFRWLDGWIMQFNTAQRHGKDIFPDDDLMRLILNRKK